MFYSRTYIFVVSVVSNNISSNTRKLVTIAMQINQPFGILFFDKTINSPTFRRQIVWTVPGLRHCISLPDTVCQSYSS